jgi:small subunit ribosomal protein S6
MRKYEAVCVFRTDEDYFVKGQQAVKAHLADLGATFVKEEDMGQRALAYPIKKHVQAHYYVYYVQMDPQQAHQVEEKVRHQEELLRFLMVRRDEDEKVTPEKPERAERPATAEASEPAAKPAEETPESTAAPAAAEAAEPAAKPAVAEAPETVEKPEPAETSEPSESTESTEDS